MLQQAFDCHTHTVRSACGEDITDEWLGERARENGFSFAVTDHTMHLYYEREIAWAMMSEDGIRLFEERRESGRETILRYVDDLRSFATENMRVGVELDVLPDGQIMFPDDLRDQMDLFVGAIHYLPTVKHKLGQEAVEEEYRRQTRWLLEYGVAVLAHPFRAVLSAGYDVDEAMVRWTVEQAAQYGTAVEINSHKPFVEHDVQMVKLALEHGLQVAWGTDAHNSREFGQFGYHEDIMRQAGSTDDEMGDVLFRV